MNDLMVNVKIWGQPVGVLYWTENGTAAFQYEKKFIKSGLDLSPIMMPLSGGSNKIYEFMANRNPCFNGLPGMIADSLPDKFGTQIINEWFASRGLPDEAVTPLDRLCYVGKRGMGALEFEPSQDVAGLESSSVLHIEELSRLADSIYTDRNHFQEKLFQEEKSILDILKIGTSAGGAKPKAIIAYNESTKEVRSGQIQAPDGFSYWLIKFDGATYSEHNKVTSNPKGIGNIEYAYYRMALDCGITMSECRLLKEGESNHFMTKRFDRKDSGEKLHMQTLAAMAHLDRDVRHSYEEAVAVMRKLDCTYSEIEEFYRRMVFNVVMRNHDDHTKNHSFLMDENGTWRLAPAYDLCYSYSPSGTWTSRHQMSLNGKQDNFTKEDLMRVGKMMGVLRPNETIERIVDVASKWSEVARECGVREDHIHLIKENLLFSF